MEARNWPVLLANVKKAVLLGYTITELRQAVAENGTLEGLRTRAPAAGQGEAGNPDGRRTLPPFSKEEFCKRLVAFIVADDQVRSIFLAFNKR